MDASRGSVFFERRYPLFPQVQGDIVEHAAAENNVETGVRPVIKGICPEEIDRNSMGVCQGAGFFQPCFRSVEGGNNVSVSGEKYGVFSFAAADVQNSVWLGRRHDFHDFIA